MKPLATMIKNAKGFDYDPLRLIGQLEKIDGLLQYRAGLEKDVTDLRARHWSYLVK